MASMRILALMAAACLLLLVGQLLLCEASRPILPLQHHESTIAEIDTSPASAIPAANFSISIDISPQVPLQSGAKYELDAHEITPLEPLWAGDCSTSDISIQQGEVSSVGLPTWQVQITNICTNPKCSISFILVHCGDFISGILVNPKVFRRLEPFHGTCIVNNGLPIANANSIIFRYKAIFQQPITFQSARVFCHG